MEQLTGATNEAIKNSTAVVGYTRYVDLIRPLLTNQKIYTSGMTEEVDRCKAALSLAGNGEIVAVVSGGDPGVYGMAGLILELNGKTNIEVEIIPGISAVNAAASLLGAPLMNDFVVVSLSDLLTPWEIIEKRIRCAAEGDFVIALYNPKSKKRVNQIQIAKEIMKEFLPGNTPVGIVTNGFRKGQSIVLSDLNHFTEEEINMLSIVIVGNSQTRRRENKLITPRGYQSKYDC